MRRMTLNIDHFPPANLRVLAALMILGAACFPLRSMAQQPGQKTFPSPDEAANALFTAAAADDEKAMLELLGPDAKQLIYSGDQAEDADSRANFARRYQEMNRLVEEPDGTTTLYVGARNWPTPIPLAHTADSWYFDTDAAKKEILFRRVGRNELSTIQVCRELVAAESEYRDLQHGEYARRIRSDAGRHDGLYWPASAGAPHSPIGPLVASAVTDGTSGASPSAPTPFRGYYFHLLTLQGRSAPGGAKNYLVQGKMTQGFAFVAYPAVYRTSGVMTFIVGNDGVVYEKDLGEATSTLAQGMRRYNPDATWRETQEGQESQEGQADR